MADLNRFRTGRSPAILIAATAALLLCALMWLSAGDAQAYKGINAFSTVQSDTQAGGHPDFEVHAKFDNRVIKNGEFLPPLVGGCGCDDPEIIDIQFPTGFIGDPHAVPKCTLALFSQQACAPESQVGVLNVGLFGGYTPIYNMEPHENEAGLLGFNIPIVLAPSFIVLHARTDSDYGLNATNGGIYHLLPISELNIYMWGVPALPSHDKFRFPIEKQQCLQIDYPNPCYPPVTSNSPTTPFLENPTTCDTDLTARLAIHYYDNSDVVVRRGYLTYAEINDHLPDDMLDAEQIENIISMINDVGISVYDEAPDAETLLMSETAPTVADEDVVEEAEAALSTVDSEFGRTTDPVRMYMREMGSVELLTRESEIEIAKRIEDGLKHMIQAISACPTTIAGILDLANKVAKDEMRIDELVDGLLDPNAEELVRRRNFR